MLKFLKEHFDFKIYGVTMLSILTALAIIPCNMFLPERFGYENGLLENIQMFCLFTGLYFAFTARTEKKFFIFAGLVLTILMLREVNCGRTLFFPIPGEVNAFYSWNQIKYGYLAHPLFGLYMASTAVYFLWNKLFVNLWNIIKKIKFPIWNVLLMILGMFLSWYTEHTMDNEILEEISELLFYVSLIGIIYLYSRNEKFMLK